MLYRYFLNSLSFIQCLAIQRTGWSFFFVFREPAILEEDEELEKSQQLPAVGSSTNSKEPAAAELPITVEQEQLVGAEAGLEKGMQETEGEKQKQQQQGLSHTPPPAHKENKVICLSFSTY